MIKRTLYFSSPAYLSLRNAQLVIKLPEVEQAENYPDRLKQQAEITKPIEDIGVLVLDNLRITLTQGLLEALLENNCAVITCNAKSMPVGLLLPLYGNTTQNERFRKQLEASLPLKKQLWQQTIQAKIANQTAVLQECTTEEVSVCTNGAEMYEAVIRIIWKHELLHSIGKRFSDIFQALPGIVKGYPPTNGSIMDMPYCVRLLHVHWWQVACCLL